MPSPFPGMDPFIEGQRWQDFHARLINDLADLLMPALRPRSVVDMEQYVYLAQDEEAPDRHIEPDLSVIEGSRDATAAVETSAGSATAIASTVYTLPLPRRERQRFLTIRDREYRKVVTVIELLSPGNKAPGNGRTEYLVKLNDIFHAEANLIELDLLRGGQRLDTREPLAPADYYAFICRAAHLPKVEVYRWTMRERLPEIPVPLARGETEAALDLQAAFTKTYDRSGYDYALDYRRPVDPPLDAPAPECVRSAVARKPEQPLPKGANRRA